MFWNKDYMPSQNIELLLEKENATVEEFLDEDDILQECKSLKKSVVAYFTRKEVVKRLLELITTDPPKDLPLHRRFAYANVACEILTVGLPSLDEKILYDADLLHTLYSYLENEPPLNPLLSSFFSKTFCMLFTKKSEQDWFLYQQMCLQLLQYLKTQNNFLDLICKHFCTPIIPDLILEMMKNIEGGQLKRTLYEWLKEDKLVERLIAILANPAECDKHANVAEFLCDLIQQGRSMRHTEMENDSFEPAFDGSNPILKTIESVETVDALLNVILEPNAQESAIVSGISVVLTLIKPVVLVDEPNSDRLRQIYSREKLIHEQIQSTVIGVIAPRLKDFHQLLISPPNVKAEIVTTAVILKPPFGNIRLHITRLFTVLLQTGNKEVSKTICETGFFETVLALFKHYCWNNFLHSEVEKCVEAIFKVGSPGTNNSTRGSTIVNDGSFSKSSTNGDHGTPMYELYRYGSNNDHNDGGGEASSMVVGAATVAAMLERQNEQGNDNDKTERIEGTESSELNDDSSDVAGIVDRTAGSGSSDSADSVEVVGNVDSITSLEVHAGSTDSLEDSTACDRVTDQSMPYFEANETEAENENDDTKMQNELLDPSALQKYVIVNCKMISKFVDCWTFNRESEAEKGKKRRRLGFMGHLIRIFKHITNCISEFGHIGALIECNFTAPELELWQSIVDENDGDFTKALSTQSRLLANCNAHEANDYSQQMNKDFLTDNSTWDYIMSSNMLNSFGDGNSNVSVNLNLEGSQDIVFALESEMFHNEILGNEDNTENEINLFQFGPPNKFGGDDDDDDENLDDDKNDEEKPTNDRSNLSAFKKKHEYLKPTGGNPWDPFSPDAGSTLAHWANEDFNCGDFADFDAHFSSFANDLGDSLASATHTSNQKVKRLENIERNDFPTTSKHTNISMNIQEVDNNANVETSQASPPKVMAPSKTHKVDDNDVTEEQAASELVRTLASVMQDSEDDYEDDDGMWTKPLGSSRGVDAEEASQKTNEEETMPVEAIFGEMTIEPVIQNGPAKSEESLVTEDAEQEKSNPSTNAKSPVSNSEKKDVSIATEPFVGGNPHYLLKRAIPIDFDFSSDDTDDEEDKPPAVVVAEDSAKTTKRSAGTNTD